MKKQIIEKRRRAGFQLPHETEADMVIEETIAEIDLGPVAHTGLSSMAVSGSLKIYDRSRKLVETTSPFKFRKFFR